MNFFIDTEFVEDGAWRPIQLISIGIVSGRGNTFYAIHNGERCEPLETPWVISRVSTVSSWVNANVIPHLGDGPWMTRAEIVTAVLRFVSEECGTEKPQFIGYYADYDWVVFCQLFGAMVDLPKGWPMWCLDIRQLAFHCGDPSLPKQESKEHNALADALWNKMAFEYIQDWADTFDHFAVSRRNWGMYRA